jgi:hypothetical protein
MSSVLALYHSGEMMRDYDNALLLIMYYQQQQQQQHHRQHQQQQEGPKWECIHCHSIMDRTNFTEFIKQSDL